MNAFALRSNIDDAQARQFRDSQPSADRKMEHGPITDAFPGGGIRRIEQSLQLFPFEMGNQTGVGDLEGDRKDATNLVECGGVAMLQEAKEGSDCSQADVAGLR